MIVASEVRTRGDGDYEARDSQTKLVWMNRPVLSMHGVELRASAGTGTQLGQTRIKHTLS